VVLHNTETEYVICFLKGLGEIYNTVKTQILLMDLLPNINKVPNTDSLVIQQLEIILLKIECCRIMQKSIMDCRILQKNITDGGNKIRILGNLKVRETGVVNKVEVGKKFYSKIVFLLGFFVFKGPLHKI